MSDPKVSPDVIVIGSGAGGASVAGELARNGVKVLIIEAGGTLFGTRGSHARNLNTAEGALLDYAKKIDECLSFPGRDDRPPKGMEGFRLAYGFGGMFSVWTSNTPPPHDEELPDCVPVAVWREYLARARAVLQIDPDPYHGGLRMARLLALSQSGVVGKRGIPMPVALSRKTGAPVFTSSRELLDVPDGMEPVEVIDNHMAIGIEWTGRRATGVKVRDAVSGNERVISAGCVVIAAGTVGAPAIMAASRMDAGPALGKYLHEHPLMASSIPLSDEVMDGVPPSDPLYAVCLPYGSDMRWQVQIVRHPGGTSTLFEGEQNHSVADVMTFVAMDVDPENRIEFDLDHLNKVGLPRITGRFRHSDADRKRISQALAMHCEVAQLVGRTSSGWAVSAYPAGSSAHMMGTTRMGAADDGTSVVDPDARMWRYENVYVAGNSIISQSSAANPTILTVAGALKTAHAILGN